MLAARGHHFLWAGDILFMSKDPAFLFYTSDFLTGTAFMSHEQIGKYIRLLCLQHQHGRLKESHMLNICSSYDEDIYSKFNKDSLGLYYNIRLEYEINRRNAYCNSRKENKLKDSHMSSHMSGHKSTTVSGHMEHRKEKIENRNKKLEKEAFISPTFEQLCFYCKEKSIQMTESELKYYFETRCGNGWVRRDGHKVKNWKLDINQWYLGRQIQKEDKKANSQPLLSGF